jgi:KUP system potassium uptake protein
MFPDWALFPMVVLAIMAAVIASQAVITGAYSLTRQAIQLGLMPRFEIRHTSESHSGQIYIPRINMLLSIGVVLLIVLFRSSSALASAYGIAVTGTMVVTAMMGFVVIWRVWKWSPFAAAALIVPFLLLDLVFLSANLLKVFEGGWVPLALGAVVMLLMYTWRRGSRLLFEKSRKLEFPLADLVAMLEKRPPQRVSGTAVFLTSDPVSAPTALMHSLKHYKVLHEKNVILTIETAPTPRIDPAERVKLEQISATFSKVTLRFGFMESPCRKRWRSHELGWQFVSWRRLLPVTRRAKPPRIPECRAGRITSSSRSAAPPMTPPTIFRFRAGGWSRWGRRLRSRSSGIARTNGSGA